MLQLTLVKKSLKRWGYKKPLALAAVLVIVFFGGYGLGNGRFSFSSSAVPANSSLPNQLNYSSVNAVYQQLKEHYDGKLTVAQLLNGLKHGLAEATGDPHTEYFTAAETKEFNSELNNQFSGIGAELGKDSSGDLQIISPIAGMPAAKAGIQAGDLIASVNGNSTSGWSIDEASSKIRGPSGTKVTLGIVRGNQTLNITITRQNLTIPSVLWKMLPNDIGYIQIITFGNDTSDLAVKAANSLKSQGVKSIILDLRGNPGGLLDAAVNVSSLWLNQGKLILQEKRGSDVINSYYATGNDILHGLPTVVLINGGSASASEITAGALHDNGAATLIGTKSYGKGSVQQIEPLAGGAELKVTVAKWYRPNGQNIDKKGIEPDKVVQISQDNINHGQDPQLVAAENYLASRD